MTPTGYTPGVSSIDDAPWTVRGPARRALTRGAAVPMPAPGPWTGDFEVRCADVHSPGCDQALRAQRSDDVVELAREHGARVHGFTPAWYNKQRLAHIAAAIGPALAEHAADDAHSDAGGHRRRTRQDIEP